MNDTSHSQENGTQTTSVAGMPLIQLIFVMIFGTTFVTVTKYRTNF